MASFPKAILTNAGKNMIAQAQLGRELIFTKGKYGDGELTGSENQQTFTNLISPKLDLPIQDMVNTGNGQTNVTVLIDRTDLLNGFFGRELGLFAKIGESGTEQLFCYTNAGALSDFIPSGDDSTIPYNEFIDITTIIGNATNVSIIVDQTKIYVTRDELNAAVEEMESKIEGIQVFEGSTAANDGKKGLVPQPLKTDRNKVLKGDGTWGFAMPTGTVINFASSTPPEGYLVCNGAAVSRTTYAALYAVIGTIYGSGDGSTTFNLPNLSDNRFVEGSTTVGTAKSAGLPNITGSAEDLYLTDSWSGNNHWSDGSLTWTQAQNFTSNTDSGSSGAGCRLNLNAALSNSIYGASATVQPKSLTLLPCIKY